MDGAFHGDTDPLAETLRQPRIPLACVLGTDPSPASAASEADVTGVASASTMAGLLIGPASTGELWVGGFEHPLARRADAHETDVPPRYQERSIVWPDERTSHGA